MTRWRRYEVMLPTQLNDGTRVPRRAIGEAVVEIRDFFGAASFETQKIEGHWRKGRILYRDNLVRIVVDVPDTMKNRRWMKAFKARWKARLEQLEIWIVSYRVEIE